MTVFYFQRNVCVPVKYENPLPRPISLLLPFILNRSIQRQDPVSSTFKYKLFPSLYLPGWVIFFKAKEVNLFLILNFCPTICPTILPQVESDSNRQFN